MKNAGSYYQTEIGYPVPHLRICPKGSPANLVAEGHGTARIGTEASCSRCCSRIARRGYSETVRLYESASHFLETNDPGELDQNLGTEIEKLTPEQLEELAVALACPTQDACPCASSVMIPRIGPTPSLADDYKTLVF